VIDLIGEGPDATQELHSRIMALCSERDERVQRMNTVFGALHCELSAIKRMVAAFRATT
jgi:hypothetical protein